MPNDSPVVTNFWRQYQRLVNDRSFTLKDDFIDLNYNGNNKSTDALSLYFRPFDTPGTLFDGPHIGYQTNRGEVVFYVPRAYRNENAMNVIEASCKDLNDAGETCTIEPTGADTVKLIIEITPIKTIATQTFDANEAIAKLSYEKVVVLFRIAKKAFPGLPRRR